MTHNRFDLCVCVCVCVCVKGQPQLTISVSQMIRVVNTQYLSYLMEHYNPSDTLFIVCTTNHLLYVSLRYLYK
jgi:hypothetical protein